MSEQPDDSRDDQQSTEQEGRSGNQRIDGGEQPPAGQGGQGGQPPAGQGGQGGQPPAGQGGQGGQPPAGQGGQGGQPPGGQAYGQQQGRQTRRQQQGVMDDVDTDLIREWVVYFVGLFGFAGFGFGFTLLILDAIDQPVFEVTQTTGFGSSSSSSSSAALIDTVAQLPLVLVAAVAAVLLGTWLGRTLDADDTTTFQTAGATTAAGVAVFSLLSYILISFTVDDPSLAVGGLVLDTLVTAIFTAVAAVGSVWVTRNLSPLAS